MKTMIKGAFTCAMFAVLPAMGQETNGCPEGSYSIVLSPDGTTLSILFDRFGVENNAGSSSQRKICRISAPLSLPQGHSIGAYKVDYRGFAKLAKKQEAELDVQYFLGPRDSEHGRVFKRKIRGPRENDYLFTEHIGAGQMKRMGCGTAAMLNLSITLSLNGNLQSGAAMASLDSSDVAAGGALVYHLDLKKCE